MKSKQKKKKEVEDPEWNPRTVRPVRVSQRKNKGINPNRINHDDHSYALEWDIEVKGSDASEDKTTLNKTSDSEDSAEETVTETNKQPSPRERNSSNVTTEKQKRTVKQVRGQTITLIPVLSQQKRKDGTSSPRTKKRRQTKKRDLQVQYVVPQEIQSNYNRLFSELQLIKNRQKVYRSQLRKERMRVFRLKKRLQAVKDKLVNHAKSQTRHDIISGATRFLAEPALSFFAHQLMRAEIKGRGMLWNDEVKTFALELYRRSPSAYQFCEEVFAMPSITRLNIWSKQREADSHQSTPDAMEIGTAAQLTEDNANVAGCGETGDRLTTDLDIEAEETADTPEKEIVEQTVVVYLDSIMT